MRLFLFDLETSGLSPENDYILELGYIVKEVGLKKPLGMSSMYFYEVGYPKISEYIKSINHIENEIIEEFGFHPSKCLGWLEKFVLEKKIDYLVAHNGRSFDKPFVMAQAKKYEVPMPTFDALPVLDTKSDLPGEFTSNRLIHLAAEFGFSNPFPHAALTDCLTLERVLDNYDIAELLAQSLIPNVQLIAKVTMQNKDLAKFKGYRWEPMKKIWHKTIKKNLVEDEIAKCQKAGFEIEVV